LMWLALALFELERAHATDTMMYHAVDLKPKLTDAPHQGLE
jgi:hypothetical protein